MGFPHKKEKPKGGAVMEYLINEIEDIIVQMAENLVSGELRGILEDEILTQIRNLIQELVREAYSQGYWDGKSSQGF